MEELAAAEEELAGSRTFVEDVDENDDPITDIDLVNLPDVLAKRGNFVDPTYQFFTKFSTNCQ
jgi:hypothetical protein